MAGAALEDLWRGLAPQVLGAVVRRYGSFDAAEEAVQLAGLAAATQWPVEGVPDDPKAWLITVASRRLIDQYRSDQARERRELEAVAMAPSDTFVAPAADADDSAGQDDTLTLLLLCCHESLTAPSQVALTLRAVGGLSTAQIARAFLVPESTMAQRISRAKQRIREVGAHFTMPTGDALAERLGALLHVLYLVFNEGYTATAGPELAQVELSTEAIRLTRLAFEQLPDDGEVAGLLALMLLTDARRPARTTAAGALVPLADQDRSLWRRPLIDEGVALITKTLSSKAVGPYQVQAAIAAVHDEAPTAAETDWRQIVVLYDLLERLSPNPVVSLNRAVAVAMAGSPTDGLAVVEALAADRRLSDHHRLHAVRGHLLEMSGDPVGAEASYRRAAQLTTSLPEQRYLIERAERLSRR
ncbi:RNA polymerase sigma factor [Angustibacter luteus]|uniref:RNA polymerase sigma factor n=1 Tax=Angustibacter luteus TaxID=658456 RepID=A0ABW1JD89_9ACTN